MSVGILGGTFDPIHQGHIAIANRAMESFNLDSVVFLVSRFPPHKQGTPLAGAYHRFAMVMLATCQHDRLYASDWELRRPGVSYTVDTLRLWTKEHPGIEHCFIAGADSLAEIHFWKDYAKLLCQYCFIFVQRPGEELDQSQLVLPDDLKSRLTFISKKTSLPSIESGKSFVLSSNHRPASSTQIRQRLAQRKSLKDNLVSSQVLKHIKKYRLYEQSETKII